MGLNGRVRVLEALKILEDATLNCKEHRIDTPEVHEALDAVERYIDTQGHAKAFRHHLDRTPQPFSLGGEQGEGQQQNLRVNFAGIHAAVRYAIDQRLGRLGSRYLRTKDEKIKAEIDRLNAELARMPARWEFTPRKA